MGGTEGKGWGDTDHFLELARVLVREQEDAAAVPVLGLVVVLGHDPQAARVEGPAVLGFETLLHGAELGRVHDVVGEVGQALGQTRRGVPAVGGGDAGVGTGDRGGRGGEAEGGEEGGAEGAERTHGDRGQGECEEGRECNVTDVKDGMCVADSWTRGLTRLEQHCQEEPENLKSVARPRPRDI